MTNAEVPPPRLVRHRAVTADIDPDSIHEDHRIAELQRPVLPDGDFLRDFLRDRFGDRRDQAGRRLEATCNDGGGWGWRSGVSQPSFLQK